MKRYRYLFNRKETSCGARDLSHSIHCELGNPVSYKFRPVSFHASKQFNSPTTTWAQMMCFMIEHLKFILSKCYMQEISYKLCACISWHACLKFTSKLLLIHFVQVKQGYAY